MECISYSVPESNEKHLNYKLTDISRLPPLPCGKGCIGDNASKPSWQEFIQTIFDSVVSTNTTINPDEPVMVLDSTYFKNLGSLLDSTSPR